MPTVDQLSYFMSGLAAGTMCIADVALIVLVSAGFWRWGVVAACAMLSLLNIVSVLIFASYGLNPLSAVILAMTTGIMAAVATSLIAVCLTWVGWAFWKKVGGLHAN